MSFCRNLNPGRCRPKSSKKRDCFYSLAIILLMEKRHEAETQKSFQRQAMVNWTLLSMMLALMA
jgi:hypothetical protein